MTLQSRLSFSWVKDDGGPSGFTVSLTFLSYYSQVVSSVNLAVRLPRFLSQPCNLYLSVFPIRKWDNDDTIVLCPKSCSKV